MPGMKRVLDEIICRGVTQLAGRSSLLSWRFVRNRRISSRQRQTRLYSFNETIEKGALVRATEL